MTAMNITEVLIKLVRPARPNSGAIRDRVRAYCSIVFDRAFAVRDVKLVEGTDGGLFLAMPSKKIADHCPICDCNNHLHAAYCNACGSPLGEDRSTRDCEPDAPPPKLYADVAHPINADCRKTILDAVMEAYEKEIEASRLPGYVCRYEDVMSGRGGSTPRRHPSPRVPAVSDRLPVRGRTA